MGMLRVSVLSLLFPLVVGVVNELVREEVFSELLCADDLVRLIIIILIRLMI